MNERMIELYKEAAEFAYKICKDEGREGGTSDHIWNTLSTGRFAELIVRECGILADQYQFEKKNPNPLATERLPLLSSDFIYEHFGVEDVE